MLDGNIGINRQDQTVTGPDYGENIGLDVFGIPGSNGPNERASGIPAFWIPTSPWPTTNGGTNYDLGTTANWMPLFRKERSYTIGSALTWVKGRHQVRTGIDIVRHELNHFQAEFGSFGGVRGGFDFGGRPPALPATSPRSGTSWPAFVLGLADIRQKDVQDIEMTGREWQYRPVRQRSLEREREADVEPRPPLRAVPAHARARTAASSGSTTPPTTCSWAAAATRRRTWAST